MTTRLKFRKNVLLMLCTAAVALTACSKDEPTAESTEPVAVRFTSSVNKQAPVAKATNSTWAAGDAIGIYMDAPTAEYTVANRRYTTDGTSSFTAATGEEIYYPVNGENVNFRAYYPRNPSQSGSSYAVNVAAQTNPADIDLMWAKVTGKNKNSGTVALMFDHKLTKVVFNIVADDGLTTSDLSDMTLKITGMSTATTFDLSTGVLSNSYTSQAPITPLPITKGVKYEAIVLPADFAATTLKVEFMLNNPLNEVFTWTNSGIETFEAGKEVTYTCTISRREVGFTATINPWISEPGRTITAN